MRRSKSNPARYARNYRKISQRHMTSTSSSSKNKEEDERKRLQRILKDSETTWKRGLAENGHPSIINGATDEKQQSSDEQEKEEDLLSLLSPELRAQFSGMNSDNLLILPSSSKKKTKKKQAPLPPLTPQEIKAAKSLYKNTQRKLQQLDARKKQKALRFDLYKQLEEHTLIQPQQKHHSTTSATNDVEGVNNNDMKQTSSTFSNNNSTTISAKQAQSLLLKSSELGKRLTKKQLLKKLHQKESLGIQLTTDEMDMLYDTYDAPLPKTSDSFDKKVVVDPITRVGGKKGEDGQVSLEVGLDRKEKGKKKKKKKKRKSSDIDDGGQENDKKDEEEEQDQSVKKKARLGALPAERIESTTYASTEQKAETLTTLENNMVVQKTASAPTANTINNNETKKPTIDYSQMMFASLTNLKCKTDTTNEELANERALEQQQDEERAAKLEEEERKRRKVYVPSEPITVSTMIPSNQDFKKSSTNTTTSNEATTAMKQHTIVLPINRPPEVQETRYDLPVSTMEYEIIDAIRTHDCTIICGETGSGKSTQVPQFLYEAGFSTCGSWWKKKKKNRGEEENMSDEGESAAAPTGNSSSHGKEKEDEEDHLLIGITQPRRVAAVSTAKRVCYEMGCGNGQSISNNNLVSYQTRFETAGLGKATHVKFMTDGILLQEIQSDLLLRKYGAIVIDEAHERNLNTDVLLGLLSVALPMRRKASEEGSLPPLKLVVMSATLKVEDFTENTRLFPPNYSRPALVTVPGRTHPVSIHHSKVTELDDYEKVAMEKICKIHRKLPSGGILVFLTGKQEIVRCVNRLRQRLESGRCGKKKSSINNKRESFKEGNNDVHQTEENHALDGFRDMDDEEVDGDFYINEEEEEDDFDNLENGEDVDIGISNKNDGDDEDDDKRPKKVRILPLYSMLSADDQAKVFAPVPDDTRLIVIATNVAETSITIPGISYVVDSGRQKCRNYHAGTGIASYDIMWISQAAADQRAGRAGRTGPGHCYRLYSSSVYSRYLDEFALPEVLTRPLEDVVLAMKAMNVSNVTSFPFPTPPEQSQINAAVRMLANLGCIDISRMEEQGGDGKITPLGEAVSKLPLGVRYGKMLLVAAQANVLDYAIALVAALSESTPFAHHTEEIDKRDKSESKQDDEIEDLDEVDQNQTLHREKERKREMKSKWVHDGGDVLAAVKAVGAYAYAGRGAGGSSEKLACRQFCEENGLHLVVMQRIAKMRNHLCKLAKTRLPNAGGVAAETGKYLPSMPPPKRVQECLLRQAITSGLLDNIARRAPPGLLAAEFSGIPRSAYICGNSKLKEPLFIDNNSTMHSKRPEWVCFDSIVRKTKKDGTTVAIMQKVTPVDPEWLASLCQGSNLMTLGSPLATPMPRYIKEEDSIQCAVETKFGGHSWEIPPCYVDMYDLIQKESKITDQRKKQNAAVIQDDSFRWFARYLLEGKVISELSGLLPMLNDEPVIITQRKPAKKVLMIVSALSDAGVDSAAALQKHWAEKDNKFLFKALKPWVKQNHADEAKHLWIAAVTSNVKVWRNKK